MTHLLRRCLVGLVAGVGLVATSVAVPGAAAAVPTVRTAWARYDFHGSGFGFLEVSGRVDPAPGAFFAVVTEFQSRSTSPRGVFADVLDLDSLSQVGTYGTVGNRDLCPGLATCIAQDGGLGFSISFEAHGDGRHPEDLRQYIVVRGAHVVIHDRILRGWAARHRSGGVTRRTVANASGAGAVALGQTVGADLGVSAPGPAGGSVAIAVPGCDEAGAGVLTLTGGVTGETALCPTYNVVAVAKRATTWNASGAVAGWSDYTTRLIVLRA